MGLDIFSTPEAFFLDGAKGRLFGLFTPASGDLLGAFLYLPPFAEEMNRCRNLVAKQARSFATLGYASLTLDFYGTGDSEGELADADWDIWLDDADRALIWLETRVNRPVTLWGCRLGALLAANLANRDPSRLSGLLLWQPVLDGKLFIKQYLRLRVAARVDRNQSPETTDQIRTRLADGIIVDVAGYPLSSQLTESIERVRMADFERLTGLEIDWFENVSTPNGALSITSQRLIETLIARDNRIRSQPFSDPPIWQLHSRDEASNLLAATTERYR
jgi:exosortase A-associated hydrolase 2